jgi:ABC-type transporter Mla subunit MlaD
MADKTGTRPVRTGGERIRKLAQAALNADVTVEQVDTILEGLGGTLDDLDRSIGGLDTTLARFNGTITAIDEVASSLIAAIERLDGIVSRVERIVEIGESLVAPISMTEQVVRGTVGRIRRSTGF